MERGGTYTDVVWVKSRTNILACHFSYKASFHLGSLYSFKLRNQYLEKMAKLFTILRVALVLSAALPHCFIVSGVELPYDSSFYCNL